MPSKASRSLRSTRKSSRRQSPAVKPANNASAQTAPPPPKRAKTNDQVPIWVEPPLKKPEPSSKEQGVLNHPLLKNLQPLGYPPPKVLLKFRCKPTPMPRIIIRTAPAEKPATSDLQEKMADPMPSEEAGRAKRPRGDEDDEVDEPQASPSTSASSSMTPITPINQNTLAADTGSASNAPTDHPARQLLDEAMATVTEKAKEASNEDLGDAILTVYATSRGDPEVARLMDAVIDMGTATEAQKHSFAKLLKRAKKNAAKRETDLADSSVNKTRQNSATAHASSPTANAANPKKSAPSLMPSTLTDVDAALDGFVLMPHISGEEMRKILDGIPNAKTNGASSQGSRPRRRATRANLAAKLSENSPSQSAPETPSKPARRVTRARARGNSTSSDLSSVDEKIVNEGLPPSHGLRSKRSAADAELVEDPEIASRRRKFNNELLVRRRVYGAIDVETSNVRGGPAKRSSQRKRASAQSSAANGRSARATSAAKAASMNDADMADGRMESPSFANHRSTRSAGPSNPKTHAGARTKQS